MASSVIVSCTYCQLLVYEFENQIAEYPYTARLPDGTELRFGAYGHPGRGLKGYSMVSEFKAPCFRQRNLFVLGTKTPGYVGTWVLHALGFRVLGFRG